MLHHHTVPDLRLSPTPTPEFEAGSPPEAEPDDFRLRLMVWALLFMSLALFAKVPNIDLWVSAHYHRPELGFFNAQQPMVLALYRYTPTVGHGLLALAAVVALLAPALARLAQRAHRPALATLTNGLLRRTAVAGLLVGVIASGLVVDVGLKGYMGRPRPVQTVEFGGTERFHAVFERGTHPDRHKSFVSGHATAGFSLMSIGLAAGATWRRRWLLIGTVTGGIVGLGRIMQGGHYLSDVVFAFFVVWLTSEAVAWAQAHWSRWRQDRLEPPGNKPRTRTPRRALR